MACGPDKKPLVDATTPSGPRVYDYLLGGKDNFAADRDFGDRLEAAAAGRGGVRDLARVNRQFILKAVTWSAAMLGIGQFLDLGCGLPSDPAVHDAARDGYDGARVVYADRDPVVASHVRALYSRDGLAAVLADITAPASVLRDEAVRELIDFGQPAALVLGGTLSAMTPDTARAAVAGYAEALAPGSAMIISCASYSDGAFGAKMAAMFAAAGSWMNHSAADVASFFAAAGLRIVHGRVADVRSWPLLLAESVSDARVIGGVGVKP